MLDTLPQLRQKLHVPHNPSLSQEIYDESLALGGVDLNIMRPGSSVPLDTR